MSGKPYQCSSVAEKAVLTSAGATKAKQVGSEATRVQLGRFEDHIRSVRNDTAKDSFQQYAIIAERQDVIVDAWVDEVAEHGEHVYGMFEDLRRKMRDRLSQLRIDIFGAEFVARQQSAINQVCGTKDALRECPH